jgi:magnesium chelatase family protein
MSFSKVYSAQANLTRATIISIEADLSRGLHSFSVVGLPDKGVEESRDRVAAAIKNSGYISPKNKNQKVVISLAPADIKKEGPVFDVPIALAYLSAADEIRFDPESKLFIGELSLDGELRSVIGILPLVREAKERGFTDIFVPIGNAKEAALISDVNIYGAKNLSEIIDHVNEKRTRKKRGEESGEDTEQETNKVKYSIPRQPQTEVARNEQIIDVDFSDIHGQEGAKRGLEIAAAGQHNIAMYGPPGTGKTMLAKAFSHLLPELSPEEMLEVTSIHSVAGILKEDIITRPPFRAPHHTASYISIVGGGTFPKPGEITLAHRGVLFMDEFPEFERNVIDSLRQPLEDRVVTISRAKGTSTFPAHVILVVAMNPCPCGNYGTAGRICICTPQVISRYQRKISGPIVDRIDLWTEVGTIDHSLLSSKNSTGEPTEAILKRVVEAREIQKERFKDHQRSIKTNSEMSARDIPHYLVFDTDAKEILNSYSERLSLSGRAHHRVMKIARTIADLKKKETIDVQSILEALQYRPKRGT